MFLWRWFRKLWSLPLSWFRRLREGHGLSVTELARRLGVHVEQLQQLQPSYQTRLIPKRSGGQRRLSIPSDELAAMQKRILRRLLKRLKCHPSATGFQRGASIVTNALPHSGQAAVVRLDVRDFFPTTSVYRLYSFFRRIGWNRPAAQLLTNLCTHNGGLPQGACTSPRLSNLVNYRLDTRITAMATKLGARYTRYADDITLSFAQDNRERMRYFMRFVCRVLAQEGYRLHGRKKRRIRRQHQQQQVTGLVVNDGPRLPRRIRRWLRAVEHHQKTGKPTTLTPQQLAGWRALCSMIDKQAGTARKRRPPKARTTTTGPLQGNWVMIAVERDGQAAPTFAAQQGPDAVMWVFDGSELRVVQGERIKRATCTLSESTQPHTITITPMGGVEAGQPVQGIYTRDGEQLIICLSESGRERPTQFVPATGSGQTLFRLRAANMRLVME